MTLALAILGTLLGAASLGWQVWTWRNDGPRVEVEASNTFPVFGDRVGDHHVTVSARNRGRAAATVSGWGIAMPNDESMVVTNPLIWSTPLPHRLEPQESASFHVAAAEVRRGCAERGHALSQLRPFVTLATGERRFAKRLPLK